MKKFQNLSATLARTIAALAVTLLVGMTSGCFLGGYEPQTVANDVVESDVGFEFMPCTTDDDCGEGETCNSQGVCTIPGENGNDGTSCTVAMNDSGCAVVTCGTISSEPICNGQDGTNGNDGTSCTVAMNDSGCAVVTCGTISSEPICNGQDGTNGNDGTSCTVAMNDSGCAVVTCGTISSEPICNGQDAPVGKACSVNADCDDGDWCTVEACDQETSSCISVLIFDECVMCDADVDCDDGDPCTDDACSWLFGWCYHVEKLDCTVPLCTDADCDDGDACTVDSCDPNVGCTNVVRECDDGDISTTDSCDPAIGCVFTHVEAECQWDAGESVCCESNGSACVIAGWLGQPTPDTDGKPLIERTLAPGECFLPDSGPAASSVCSVTQVTGGSLTGACALKAGGVGITHDGICGATAN